MRPAPIASIAMQYEPRMKKLFAAEVALWSAGVSFDSVAAVAFNPEKVFALLSVVHGQKRIATAMKPLLAAAYVDGASISVGPLKSALGITTKAVFPISLEEINPLSVAWALAHAGALVVAPADVREQIRIMVAIAQAKGIDVRVLARQLRGIIGLDPARMRALQRFTERLVDEERPLNEIQRRVTRHATALVASRAMTIARTESIAATNAGQQVLWNLSMQRGLIRRDAMAKTWIVTPDELLCEICENLDGETTEVDGEFSIGVVTPPAHPNCRCATGLVRKA